MITQTSGAWTLAQTLPDTERDLPESVRGMIERKIAQLGEDDRRLLTAAGAQGYEFDSAVVAEALGLDAGEVEERLETLDRVYAFVRLLSEEEFPNRALTLRYRFVHVLYQNALYGSLRGTRRATMSAAIARALLGFYGDQSGEVAPELAYLFSDARDFARAADYFRLAALNAVKLFATQEAVELARRGLEQIQSLPESSERRQQELALQVVLGNTLIATKGFAAVEVGQTWTRARELCQQCEESTHLLPVLFGLSVFHWVGGRHRQALELGREFLALASQQKDEAVIVAQRMVGGPFWCLGELAQARSYFEQIVAQHDSERQRALAYLYGQEPGVAGRTFLAWALWLLGYPDQALKRCQEALSLAREVEHAPSQAYALAYAAILHAHRREPEPVNKLAEAVIELSAEHGLAQFSSWGDALQGWARAALGKTGDGIEQMRRGLAASLATGTEVMRPHYLSLLAEAYDTAGQPEEVLAALDEMKRFIEKNDERCLESELYRLRGELLSKREAPLDEIEGCFQQARAIACKQNAKALELRVAISLARFRRSQDQAAAARQQLAEVYDWFTEGFDTPDLQTARALLDDIH